MELSIATFLIAGYVGLAMASAQFLYTRYVKNDPQFKGRIPMGIRFRGDFRVSYKCGYWFALSLLFCSIPLVTWLLLLLPEVGSLTTAGLIRSSGCLLWTLALVLLSHFFTTSTTKLALNLSTIGMMCLSVYASIGEADFKFLAQCIIAFAAFMGALGVGWFIVFQVPRLRKFEDKRDFRSWILKPVEYFWGTYAVSVVGGTIVAVLVYGLSH